MKRDFDDFDREECFDSSYLDSERYAGESLYMDEYPYEDERAAYFDERQDYTSESEAACYEDPSVQEPNAAPGVPDDGDASDSYDDPMFASSSACWKKSAAAARGSTVRSTFPYPTLNRNAVFSRSLIRRFAH